MYGTGLLKVWLLPSSTSFPGRLLQYPEQMPELQERFRGRLYLEFEKCIVGNVY